MKLFTSKIKTGCLLLLLMNSAIAICMNVAKRPQIIEGKLLIDDEYHVKRNYLNKAQIEYIPQQDRKCYPYGNAFTALPLETPFVKVIMETPDQNICTIFPATKLMNCNNGSMVQLNDRNHTFNLTCDENYILIIKEKYFPQDEKITGFEKQFLASMNQFYGKTVYFGKNPHQKEFEKNGILTITGQIHLPAKPMKTFYSHGPKGCGSENNLIQLATNPKTRNNGYSAFSHVMNRQHTNTHSSKALQPSSTETKRLI